MLGRGPLLAWFVVHTVVWIALVRLLPGGDFVEYPDLGTAGLRGSASSAVLHATWDFLLISTVY